MLVEFFEKLENSKWLPWVGMTPFILIPVVIMFGGEVPKAVGIFAFFASMWAGIYLGGGFARVVFTQFFRVSANGAKRLIAAFSAFGFLFAPVLVGSFTNTNLGTEIEMYSLSVHFLWACFGAAIFFTITPEDSKINK